MENVCLVNPILLRDFFYEECLSSSKEIVNYLNVISDYGKEYKPVFRVLSTKLREHFLNTLKEYITERKSLHMVLTDEIAEELADYCIAKIETELEAVFNQ